MKKIIFKNNKVNSCISDCTGGKDCLSYNRVAFYNNKIKLRKCDELFTKGFLNK